MLRNRAYCSESRKRSASGKRETKGGELFPFWCVGGYMHVCIMHMLVITLQPQAAIQGPLHSEKP